MKEQESIQPTNDDTDNRLLANKDKNVTVEMRRLNLFDGVPLRLRFFLVIFRAMAVPTTATGMSNTICRIQD